MIPSDVWQELIERRVRRTYRSTEHLLVQGDRDTSLRLIVSGRVEVVLVSPDGNTTHVALRAYGDVLGELAARMDGLRSASVIAIEPCVAYAVPEQIFRDVLVKHRQRDQFDRYLVQKFNESTLAKADLAHQTPAGRLVRLLLRLVDLADPDHPDPLRIPMSQTKIASTLGLSRSKVAELVATMRVKGVLAPGRHLAIKDLELLRTLR
jgi:CRP/FNR family cyclic AMP-dependent transcriptional regulator